MLAAIVVQAEAAQGAIKLEAGAAIRVGLFEDRDGTSPYGWPAAVALARQSIVGSSHFYTGARLCLRRTADLDLLQSLLELRMLRLVEFRVLFVSFRLTVYLRFNAIHTSCLSLAARVSTPPI